LTANPEARKGLIELPHCDVLHTNEILLWLPSVLVGEKCLTY